MTLPPLRELNLSAVDASVEPRLQRVKQQESRFVPCGATLSEKAAQKTDKAALSLLERICLFRLGVNEDVLARVFTGEGKEKASGRELARLSRVELQSKLGRLVKMGLVEYEGQTGIGSTRWASTPFIQLCRDGFLSNLNNFDTTSGHEAASAVSNCAAQ